MTSLPLHPAIVHLPLGLAFIIPALAAGFAWALWTGRVRPRAWAVIVVLQLALFGGALVAMSTGEREEDRVEALVPDSALEQHEMYADRFVWATGVTLGLATLVLLFRRTVAVRMLASATVAGSLVVAASAVLVGHAGAKLVYVHNAGAAYTTARASASAGQQQARRARGESENRDERQEVGDRR